VGWVEGKRTWEDGGYDQVERGNRKELINPNRSGSESRNGEALENVKERNILKRMRVGKAGNAQRNAKLGRGEEISWDRGPTERSSKGPYEGENAKKTGQKTRLVVKKEDL